MGDSVTNLILSNSNQLQVNLVFLTLEVCCVCLSRFRIDQRSSHYSYRTPLNSGLGMELVGIERGRLRRRMQCEGI